MRAGQANNQVGPRRFAFLVALVELGINRFRNDLQLFARRRPIHVDRDQHGPVTALFEPCSQFAGGGGFTGTLQAGHQNHRRRLRGEFEARRILAQQRDQLVAHDLDHLFGGRKRRKHLGANGFHADLFNQIPSHVEVDVGLEQGHADFAQSLGDVFFAERTLAAKGFKGTLEFVCKVFKHRSILSVSRGRGRRDSRLPRSQRRDLGYPDSWGAERQQHYSAGAIKYCSSFPSG